MWKRNPAVGSVWQQSPCFTLSFCVGQRWLWAAVYAPSFWEKVLQHRESQCDSICWSGPLVPVAGGVFVSVSIPVASCKIKYPTGKNYLPFFARDLAGRLAGLYSMKWKQMLLRVLGQVQHHLWTEIWVSGWSSDHAEAGWRGSCSHYRAAAAWSPGWIHATLQEAWHFPMEKAR